MIWSYCRKWYGDEFSLVHESARLRLVEILRITFFSRKLWSWMKWMGTVICLTQVVTVVAWRILMQGWLTSEIGNGRMCPSPKPRKSATYWRQVETLLSSCKATVGFTVGRVECNIFLLFSFPIDSNIIDDVPSLFVAGSRLLVCLFVGDCQSYRFSTKTLDYSNYWRLVGHSWLCPSSETTAGCFAAMSGTCL